MEFLRARRSAVVTVAVIFVVCLAIATLIHIVNRPVSARIITATPPPTTQATPSPQLTSVNGTYASFSYPDSMHPMSDAQSASTELASYNYLKADILTWHLAIGINQLQTPSLDSDSSYTFRKGHPAEYQESTVTYGGNTFTVMTDTEADGFGEVAFTLHGSIDATISLVGDDSVGTSSLDTAFQEVLQSWQWH